MKTVDASTGTQKVAIVIVNWNGSEDTLRCLESLQAASRHPVAIVVVDNGSLKEDPQTLKDAFPAIRLIRSPVNLGFSRGNNLAIEVLLEEGYTHILLLNNDTLVKPGFLDPLLDFAQANPDAGIVSPFIYTMGREGEIQYAGERLRFFDVYPAHLKSARGAIVESDVATGACMLVPAAVFREVGLLPTEYFLLWEDLDFSMAVRRAGYRIAYVRDSGIYHRRSASFARVSGLRVRLSLRNRFIFWRKYGSPQKRTYVLLRTLLMDAPLLFVTAVLLNPSQATFQAFWQGLWAGLRAMLFGKYERTL